MKKLWMIFPWIPMGGLVYEVISEHLLNWLQGEPAVWLIRIAALLCIFEVLYFESKLHDYFVKRVAKS